MQTSITRRTMLGAVGGAAALGWPASRAAARQEHEALPQDELPAGPDVDWAAVRRQFLLPADYAFMNNGAIGACPESVLARTMQAWRRMERAPVQEGYGALMYEADAVRARVAAFLGARQDDITITTSTTDAMNLIAQGIDLQPGDRVLTTDQEHKGGRMCWEYFAEHRGVQIDVVKLPGPADDPDEIVRRVERGLSPRTRVVSVSHVTFTTGLRLPVARIAELARAHGALLVVDGAQAPGGMRVDVKALGCHAYATSGHKWMLAPKGTGVMYISPEARAAIRPLRLHDGNLIYTGATGFVNLPGVIGLGAAVEFLERLGMDAIERHNFALRAHLVERLQGLGAVRVLSPPAGTMASPLVSVQLPEGVDNVAIQNTLRERDRISVKVIRRDEHFNGLRFSMHVYNREEDYDRLVTALDRELG